MGSDYNAEGKSCAYAPFIRSAVAALSGFTFRGLFRQGVGQTENTRILRAHPEISRHSSTSARAP